VNPVPARLRAAWTPVRARGWNNSFRSCAHWLLAVGRAGTAEHVERIVRGWRFVDRKAEARDAARRHAGRALHVYQDDDGMVRVRGRLAPEMGTLLMKALDAARDTLYQQARMQQAASSDDDFGGDDPCGGEDVSAETPTFEQQQADALALLAETALHHGLDPGTAGERYQVVVHVDAPVLTDAENPGQSVLENGLRVPAETSQRLACDAGRVVMVHDPPTVLSNLTLLCRRHHRAVHEEGFHVERQADGELEFRSPHGWAIPDVPSLPDVPDDPIQVIRGQNEAAGLRLNAHTATPG